MFLKVCSNRDSLSKVKVFVRFVVVIFDGQSNIHLRHGKRIGCCNND